MAFDIGRQLRDPIEAPQAVPRVDACPGTLLLIRLLKMIEPLLYETGV